MPKQRADQMLVDRGLAESRTRAQALIMAGLVFAGDRKVDKPGQHSRRRPRSTCAGATILGVAAGSSSPMRSRISAGT